MKQRRNKKVLLVTAVLFLMMFFTVSVQASAGWKQNTNGTYSYYSKKGKLVKKKWIQNTYYVNKYGIRHTGWLKQKGKYYYFAKSGKVLKNMWIRSEDKMYYAGADGAVYTSGMYTIGVDAYYFSKRGVRLYGKRSSKGNTYYFSKKKNGRMQKDIWVKSNGKYYFCGSDGAILKNQWVGLYYVGSSGARLTNTWKENKYLGSTGEAVKGLQQIGGTYFYFHTDTYEKVTNMTIEVSGLKYQFDADGKGTLVSDNGAPAAKVSVHRTYYTDPYVDDQTLLSAIIYREAGNQLYEGKLAVGCVIYNRVYSKSCQASTVREVIYQSGQFTPASDGGLTRALKNPELIPAECVKAAKEVMKLFSDYQTGTTVKIKINEKETEFPYLFFMTPGAYRSLGLTAKYIKIDGHVFFKTWK